MEPITTYGAECWQLTSKEQRQLQALKMDFLRRSCRISKLDHIRNDDLREMKHIEDTKLIELNADN